MYLKSGSAASLNKAIFVFVSVQLFLCVCVHPHAYVCLSVRVCQAQC